MLIEQHLSYKIYSDLPKDSLLIDFPDNLQRPNPEYLKNYPESANYDARTWKPTHNFDQVPRFYSDTWNNLNMGEKETRADRNAWKNSVLKKDPLSISPKKVFINHSFEPIRFEYDRYFWNDQHFNKVDGQNGLDLLPDDTVCILHSEQSSLDIDIIQATLPCDIKFVHWFSHG